MPMIRLLLILCVTTSPAFPQTEPPEPADADWDVTLARGETRRIEFDADEGTFMSVSPSGDGRWIYFDLLAHVYRVRSGGGDAECLTGDSGVAVNYHPAVSPDGRTVAFVSDRGGQNNLWLMDADGANPRAVFEDRAVRIFEPAWTPDSQYIVARRQKLGNRVEPTTSGIWMFHRDGGSGVELIGNDTRGASWPTISGDGHYLYFHASDGPQVPSGYQDPTKGSRQLKRFRFEDGQILDITSGIAAQQIRSSSGGAYAPEVSPDGTKLAFARRIPDGTITYKGHRFGPRTALWLRDLDSGSERLLVDPVEQDMAQGMKTLRVLPGYRFAADGESIVFSQGGKLRRVDLDDGEVSTIPFNASVDRTISEMARAQFRIEDGPMRARFLRWYQANPAMNRLVFQAVGKLWTMALPRGTPNRLTSSSFPHHEYSPSYSPDGQWIAFTTWTPEEGGHLWKVPSAGGGNPFQVSRTPGEYMHPIWTDRGREILVVRGAGATERGRTIVANAWHDVVRFPSEGESDEGAELVTTISAAGGGFSTMRSQIPRLSLGPEDRIYFPQPARRKQGTRELSITQLVSVAPDGSDRRVHAELPFADEVLISPDGDRIVFQEGDNVFLSPLPRAGTGKPITIDKTKPAFPAIELSTAGGLFPSFIDSGHVSFGNAGTFYVHDLRSEETTETEIALDVPRNIPSGSIALEGARILTMENREVIEDGTVVIRNGRLSCVGVCSTNGVQKRIDVGGKTIVPGIVDMHAHHYREYRGIIPRRNYETAIYLAYGVTTNLDNSMWSQAVFPAAELIEAGEVIGPRTFSTGDPLYRGDGPRQNALKSYEVTENNILRLQSWGATAVKQYLQPRRDQRQWVSDIARKLGLMVTSEGSDLAYNMGMIMDGQTAWEHPMSYMPIYSDVARFFGKAGAVYSPTFVVGGPGPWNEEFYFQRDELWKDEKQRRWLPWRQLIPHTRRHMTRPETDYSFPLVAQGLADIIAEGGHGAIGSHGQQHGIASHWEIWMAAEALGPIGALEIATIDGAYFLGADEDLGSLVSGKLADLIVLNSNPLDDIENTLDMAYVMKGGVLYEADTLDEIWPTETPFGDYYWVDEDALKSDTKPVIN